MNTGRVRLGQVGRGGFRLGMVMSGEAGRGAAWQGMAGNSGSWKREPEDLRNNIPSGFARVPHLHPELQGEAD